MPAYASPREPASGHALHRPAKGNGALDPDAGRLPLRKPCFSGGGARCTVLFRVRRQCCCRFEGWLHPFGDVARLRKHRMPQGLRVDKNITCRRAAQWRGGVREYANIVCRRAAQPRRGYGNTQVSHAAGRSSGAGVMGIHKYHMSQGGTVARGGDGNTQISHAAGRHSGAGGTGIRKYRMPQSSAVAQGLHEYANIACRREEQWRRGYGNTQISYAAERRSRAGVTGMRKHHMPQGLCIYAGCCDGETARGFFA